MDHSGNLYIADVDNNRVRIVDTTGVINTVAGNGTAQYCGDGGPAISACLTAYGVALDNSGNVYVSDNVNNRVREIAADTGIISTVVGSGLSIVTDDCP